MSGLEPRSERDELARELETETALAMVRKIGRDVGRGFDSWREVGDLLCSRTAPDEEKDSILRAVGIARDECPHPLWNSVYLYLFFPGLRGLHRAKRRWGEDGPEEFWQDLVAAFLESVRRFDVGRWPDRIAARLLGHTRKRLHRRCEPRWEARRSERPLEPRDLEIAGATPGIDWASLELGEVRESELRSLAAARDSGVIGEADYHLLVGTCVYGRSSAEIARERGVSDEGLRKRKQRARAAVMAWRRKG